MEQRQWIDIEIQASKDPHCIKVSKFITRLLRLSQKVQREDDGAVHCDHVIEECKKSFQTIQGIGRTKLSKQQFANIPHWPIDKWISVLAKGGGQKKRFQYCLNLNHVPSRNPRTFRKCNQFCMARQCTVTRMFYRENLSRRKRKRIEVNGESWFDSRRSQSQNRQTCCVLHYCVSDG